MTSLLASELLKLRTVRAPYWLLGVPLVSIGVFATLVLVFAPPEELTSASDQRFLIALAGSASFVPLILGIMVIAGEFRHATITQTFLAEPVRERVLLAKILATALVGVVFAAVAFVLMLVIAVIGLGARGIDVAFEPRDVSTLALGIAVATILYAALGVGVGAAVRSQVGAIVLALAWFWIVEGILSTIAFFIGGALAEAVKFFPGVAASAIVDGEQGQELLSPVAGGAVFAAYAVALGALGTMLIARRDIA